MRVVITGATGFIGAALARRLAEEGAEVLAVARPGADGWRLAGIKVGWVSADILSPATLDNIFSQADWVIHAAGKLGAVGVPEAVYHRLHVDGTRHVLQAVRQQAPRARVLYIGSLGVVGPVADPARADWPDESAPLAPTNPYERSKAAAEEVALTFSRQGLDIVLARPEFVYGPGDTHVLGLFRAIQRRQFFYVGDGLNWCHPTYVDDCVAGLLACLRRARSGALYHLAGPQPVTWRAFAATAANCLGVPAPRLRLPYALLWPAVWLAEAVGGRVGWRPPLSRSGLAFFSQNRGGSWAAAQADLGYGPRTDLTDGFSQTIAWYRQRGWL